MAQMNAQYTLYAAGGGMATISTQSTAVQLSTTSVPCQMVMLQGISTNTSLIVVGPSTVKLSTTARVGIPVYVGSTSQPTSVYCRNLNEVYIDGISTEAVSFTYYAISVP